MMNIDKIKNIEYRIDELVSERLEINAQLAILSKQLQRAKDYEAMPEIFKAMSYQHVPVGKFKTYAEAQKYLDRCDMAGYVVADKDERFYLVDIHGEVFKKFKTKEDAFSCLCRMDPESQNFYEIRED